MTGKVANESTDQFSFFSRKINESSDHTRYITIILLIIVMRLVFHFVVFNTLSDDYEWWKNDDYDEIAVNILAGHGYVASEGLDPDTSRTPLYVYFLVIQFFLFGKSIVALIVSQSILQGIACIGLYKLAVETIRDRNLALLAVLGVALFPQSLLYASYFHPESLFLLFSVFSGLYFYRFWKEPCVKWAILSGVMIGLLTLTKPIPQLLIFPLALAALYRYRNRFGHIVKTTGLMFASFVVVIAPWVVRNYMVEDGFVSVASRGGRFFHQVTIQENQGDIDLLQDIENQKEEEIIENKEGVWIRSAVSNILDNPGLFITNILKNMIYFWYRGHFLTVNIVNGIINFSLLLLAIVGFFKARKRDIPVAPFVIMILYYNCIHAFTFGMARYAFPIIPFLLIFSVYGLFMNNRFKLLSHLIHERHPQVQQS